MNKTEKTTVQISQATLKMLGAIATSEFRSKSDQLEYLVHKEWARLFTNALPANLLFPAPDDLSGNL